MEFERQKNDIYFRNKKKLVFCVLLHHLNFEIHSLSKHTI